MSFEDRVHELVDQLLGADPVLCAQARDALLSMGGFSHPYIREVLDRESRSTGRHGRVGGHVLGEVIGRGGFGTVYRTNPVEGVDGACCLKVGHATGGGAARVPRLPAPAQKATSQGVPWDQRCADALHDAGVADPSADEVQEVVLEEAALLRALEGDLFPRVHASGVEGQLAWYAMELLEGPTLRELIRSSEARALPLTQLVARVCRELADLRHLDDRFFHGDLKPENLVFIGGRLRAIDPALRRPVGRLQATLTLAYNPVALSGEQADTCALSLTLLEALFGRVPFDSLRQPLAEVSLPVDETMAPLERRLVGWVMSPPSYAEMDRQLRKAV